MLLNNYWNWKKIVESTDYTNKETTLQGVLTGRDGNPVNMVINSSNTYISKAVSNRTLYTNTYLAIGTGTIQPTKEDYDLSEPITLSSLTYTKNEYINDDGILVKAFGISGFNGTGQDKLITEAILYKKIFINPSWEDISPVAFVREVFQTPILIEADKNFMINFEWTEQ